MTTAEPCAFCGAIPTVLTVMVESRINPQMLHKLRCCEHCLGDSKTAVADLARAVAMREGAGRDA